MRLYTAFGAVILALSAFALSSCSKPAGVEARSSSAPTVPQVAVAKASRSDLSHTIMLTAEFTPFQEIDVMAKVSGYVKQINVDVGDRVHQGQLLATLEIPEMANDVDKGKASVSRSDAQVAQAQDEIRRAESAHQIAHLSYERLAGVNRDKPGLVAQQEIDDAHSKDLVAEAQVAAAKSNLVAATQQVDVNKAELARVHTMLDYTRVTAPFTGVITKRYANTGSMIQAGTSSQTQAMPLVRLSENSLLRLTLPVPESAVAGIHVGQQVSVNVPTLNRTFTGKVARSADQLQLATRTMDTEVDVPNPGLLLIPGMYAEVQLTLNRSNEALSVPVAAVDLDSENAVAGNAPTSGRVLVVNANNKVEARTISIGMETADRVEVRSGLQEGDLVVIGNRSGLQSREPVRPKLVTMTPSK